MRLWAAILAVAGLAACETGGARSVTVAGGAVTISGPPGYCVDTAASRDGESAAFVLLGACSALAGQGGGAGLGVLTATVGAPQTAQVTGAGDELAAFFQSDAGRRALSRSGQADRVQILAIHRQSDALYLHLRDTSPGNGSGLVPEYWRGMFDLGDRLATVSVMDFATAPRSDAQGLATARIFVQRIRSAN